MSEGYPALTVARGSGEEQLHQDDQPLGVTLLDFWRWSVSDLVSNAMRGRLAEFIQRPEPLKIKKYAENGTDPGVEGNIEREEWED